MPSTKPPFDPTAYAMKRKEQIEKAKELRSARSMVLSNSPPRDPSALRRSSYPSEGTAGIPRRSRSRGASPPRRFGPNDPLSGTTRRARSRGASPPRRMGSLLETVDPPQRRGRGFRKNSLPEDGPAMAFDERESSWLVGSNGKANQDDLSSFLDPPENVSSEPASRTGRRAVSGPVVPPSATTETFNSAGHERRPSLGNTVTTTTPRSTKKTKENFETYGTEPTTPGSKEGTGGEGGSTGSDTNNPSTEGKGKGIFSRFRSSTMKLFRKGMGGSATTDVEPEVPTSPSTPPRPLTSPRPATGGSKGKAVPSDLTGTTLSTFKRVPIIAERSHGFESPSKRGPNKLPSSSPGGSLLQNPSEPIGDGNLKTTPKSLENGNRKKTGMASDSPTGKEITGSNPTATPVALQSKTLRNGDGISGRSGGGKGTETKGLTKGGTSTVGVSKGPVGRGATGGTGVSPGSVGKKEGRAIKAVLLTPSDRMRASTDLSASESHGESETLKLGRQSGNSTESVANGDGKEKTSWFTRSKNEGKTSKQSEGLSRSASAGLPPEHVDKDPHLQKCPDCGRKFFPEALEKHSRVCRKVFLTKRKTFNSTVKRLAGTEAAQYLKPAKKGSTKSVKEDPKNVEARKTAVTEGKKPKWRAQSEELQAAIRAGRQEKGESSKSQHHISSL